jgi:hypothetical protein
MLGEASLVPRVFRGKHRDVTDEVIARYIEEQRGTERDEDADFKVEE